MVRQADPLDFNLTLLALYLYTQALMSPMHHDQLFALKVELVAKLATRHENIACAGVKHMVLEVRVGEDFIALFASEFLLVEKCQHKPVDFLKAFSLCTIWAFLVIVIEGGHTSVLPPPDKTFFAIQIVTLAAL